MLLSRLSLNSLWLLLSRIGAQLGMALFTVLLARGLGSAGFGEYAFIASVIVIGNVLTTFGTDMLLIREIAATGDLSGLSPALVIQLVLSAIFIAVVFIGSALSAGTDAAAASALRIYSLAMLPLAFFTVFTTALRGRQHMLAYALLNLGLMLLQVIAAVWLFWRHLGLVDLAVALLVVQVGAALLAAYACTLRLPDLWSAWRFTIDGALKLARSSAAIALLGLLGVIYQRFSLVILPGLSGAAAAGWFSAGARLIEAAKIGHVAVFTALYPLMAQANRAQGASWTRSFRLPGLMLMVTALAGSFGLYLLANVLVPILYGSAFLEAVPLVRILAWMLIPYSLNSFVTLAFLAHGEESAVVRALALGILTLVLLTVWWVPVAGVTGAAWAALCAEITQALILVLTDLRGVHILRSLISTQPIT